MASWWTARRRQLVRRSSIAVYQERYRRSCSRSSRSYVDLVCMCFTVAPTSLNLAVRNSFGTQVGTRTTRIFLVCRYKVSKKCAVLLEENLLLCNGEVLHLFVAEGKGKGKCIYIARSSHNVCIYQGGRFWPKGASTGGGYVRLPFDKSISEADYG